MNAGVMRSILKINKINIEKQYTIIYILFIMESRLPTMEEIKNCFLEESIKNMTQSGKIRRRSYSTSEENIDILMNPNPPLIEISSKLQSQSMPLPVRKNSITEYSDYNFHCKNMTTNIK